MNLNLCLADSQFVPGGYQFVPRGPNWISICASRSELILNLCLEDLNLFLEVRIGFQFVPPGPKWENPNLYLEVRIGFQFVPPGTK